MMTPYWNSSAIRPDRPVRVLLHVMMSVLILAGCGSRVELVGSLPENEANEVLGALLNAGIDASKEAGKGGTSIHVDQAATARAIDILRQRGLPRERRAKMGDIFKKENLVSSPLEERARYLYALSQELEQTLSQIDGVVTARVHIVLPESTGTGTPLKPSSASIFLKHQAGYGVEHLVVQVRGLVATGIPGLTPDKVTVTLVQAVDPANAVAPARMEDVLFLRVEQGSATSLRVMLVTLAIAAALAAAAITYFVMRHPDWERFKSTWLARIRRTRD